MSHADERFDLVTDWVTRELRLTPRLIEPASSDASFRRYFRVFHEGGTHIVMDAPPGREDVRPYLNITVMLETAGVHVPRVYEWDIARGRSSSWPFDRSASVGVPDLELEVDAKELCHSCLARGRGRVDERSEVNITIVER